MSDESEICKERASYQALRTYGFLLDGPSENIDNIDFWPEPIENETFGQWKQRVFGEKIQIYVYKLYEPKPQTKMSTLALEEQCGGKFLKKIFKKYGRFRNKKTGEILTKKFSTFPKETLELLIDDYGDDSLQPALTSLLKGYLDDANDDIDTEKLLKGIIEKYNSAVIEFKKLENKYDQLQSKQLQN